MRKRRDIERQAHRRRVNERQARPVVPFTVATVLDVLRVRRGVRWMRQEVKA